MSQGNTPGVIVLKGKRYATVPYRTALFREAHPVSEGWGIQADVRFVGDNVVVKASVVDAQGRVVADGHAMQSLTVTGKSAEATNPVEVAETSAVGRALAFAGYPGDADMGIASAEEMIAAMRATPPVGPPPEPMEMGQQAKIRNIIGDLADALGKDIDDFDAKAFEVASKAFRRKVEGWGQISATDAAHLIKTLEKMLAKAIKATKESK